MDEETTAPEKDPPVISVVFEGPHRTGAQLAFSSTGVDVGQMIIARELISREIESFYRQMALLAQQKKSTGIVIPQAIPRRVE